MVPLVSMDTFNPIATRGSSGDFDPDSNIKSCSFTSSGGFIGSSGWTFPFAVQMQEVRNIAELRLSDRFFFSFCRWLLQTQFHTKYKNSSARRSRLWISA